MVDIGKLNKRITFQRVVKTEDELGHEKVSWEDYKTVWATVKPFKASESSFMSKLKPDTTHRFYVRYRGDIEPDMRIVYHGRTFEIDGVPIDLDERHEMLEIQAEEVFDGTEYGI